VIGGSAETDLHILLIIASDLPMLLEAEVAQLHAELRAPSIGLSLVYDECGTDLSGALAGHEHFGFKDGISQPGIRGCLPEPPPAFLTPRLLDPSNPAAAWMSRPGQPLVWPGQFVFGYPTQDAFVPLLPGPDKVATPAWARNGSFLVFRRLRQDVARFRQFIQDTVAVLSATPGFHDVTAEHFAALLVGRWPSGTPLLQSPTQDDDQLADDALGQNHFTFNTAAPRLTLIPGTRPAGDVLGTVPGDVAGFICPRAAHIRKVNPRDVTTEQGNDTDTLTRRILRRGIPFGPQLPTGSATTADAAQGNRGLLFLCYQTSIIEQFEFLCRNWMNHTAQPEANDAGHDLLVGQNADDAQRVRRCTLVRRVESQVFTTTITAPGEWVIPTGGGYFFAPSVSALRHVLCR
jgi:Dyp-type peroxidase family